MQFDIRYSDEERAILSRAVEEANRSLDKLWPGYGRRYHVAYIELGTRTFDETTETLRPVPGHFLAGDAREASV